MTEQDPHWQPPQGDPISIAGQSPPQSPPQSTSVGPPLNLSPEDNTYLATASAPTPASGGFGDSILGVVWSVLGFGVFLVSALVGLVLAALFIDLDLSDLVDAENAAESLPAGALAMSLVFQQIGQAGWPLIVGKWFPGVDWADLRIGFKPVDLGIGLGTAFIALFTASVFGFGASKLVGLEDQSAADNTQFLTDAKGSVWLYVIVFCVVVGAPVAEELFFRGLVLSAFEKLGAAIGRSALTGDQAIKRASMAVGVLGSTIIFTLPHFIGGTWQETVVLFSSIGAVGVVLALAAMYTNRLGAPIVAHMLFNSVGAAAALGAFDSFQTT